MFVKTTLSRWVNDMSERERLIELLKKSRHLNVLCNEEWEWKAAADELLENGVAVGVVRCKDCVYCDGDGRCEAPENGLIREYVTPDEDYCSYAERKEG